MESPEISDQKEPTVFQEALVLMEVLVSVVNKEQRESEVFRDQLDQSEPVVLQVKMERWGNLEIQEQMVSPEKMESVVLPVFRENPVSKVPPVWLENVENKVLMEALD